MTPWYVFAGGGTGGHLFPALAIVEALRGRGEAADVSFFCTGKQIDRDILSRVSIPAMPLPVQPFTKKPWLWPKFLLHWRQSVRYCRRQFEARRPAVVVGAGGYASGPPVHAALQMGIPTFLLSPDAVPGRANLHFSRKGVTAILSMWEVNRKYYPSQAPVIVTGCPVRAEFTAFAEAGPPSQGGARGGIDHSVILRSFGLAPQKRTLLVTGASQGARTINAAAVHLAASIAAAGWQVLHLSGSQDVDMVTAGYRDAGTPHVVLPFTNRMPEAMAAADLIISRAGASSLAEILVVGKPSILLPYPFHRDKHQWHNGAALVEAGAAVIVDDKIDPAANAAELAPVLSGLMCDDARRGQMSAAALTLARPEAARRIAEMLATVAAQPAGSSLTSDELERKFCLSAA